MHDPRKMLVVPRKCFSHSELCMYTGETKNDLKLKIAQKACKHIKPSKSTSPSNTVVLFALNIEGLRTSGYRLI